METDWPFEKTTYEESASNQPVGEPQRGVRKGTQLASKNLSGIFLLLDSDPKVGNLRIRMNSLTLIHAIEALHPRFPP